MPPIIVKFMASFTLILAIYTIAAGWDRMIAHPVIFVIFLLVGVINLIYLIWAPWHDV
jgi:hypothetical protein